MTTPARKYHQYMTHQISKTINYSDSGITAGVLIGELPAGAVLKETMIITDTAWNGTVSVALSVGTTATGTDLINGSDVRTAAARVDTVVPVAKAGPLAADQAYYASVALGGTAGSAGRSTVVITYHPNIG
jgi:hypothetical protein